MNLLVFLLAYIVLKCAGLDLEHNCTFQNEIIQKGIGWGYPKPGDIPLLNRKVIRGRRVSIVEHPYIVSIRRQMSHYLVGTLVGGNLVATIAHPLVDVPIVDLGVVVGQNYNDRGNSVFTVILIIFHEDFDRSTLKADLALIRLHEPIYYRTTVKPVRNIYALGDKFEETFSGFVTGWGRCDLTGKEFCLPRSSIYFRDEFADPMLRSININLKEPTPLCDIYHNHDVDIGSGMLCLGPARQEDHTCPCLAVPGAPLVVEGRLLGLLSWGFGCGYHTDLPLIYTDMRIYYKWIVNNINKMARLNERDFDQLFGTTKMAVIIEWFSATRNYDVQHEHPDLEIQPWKIDKDLAFIEGRLYDIRDFYGRQEYHEEKFRRYQLIRQSLMDEVHKSTPNVLAEHRDHYWLDNITSSDTESDDYDNDNDYDTLLGNPYYNYQLLENGNKTNHTVKNIASEEEDYF